MTEKQEAKLHEKLEKFLERNDIVNMTINEGNDLSDLISEHNDIISYNTQVGEFMLCFKQEFPEKQITPDNDLKLLRLNLILEELKELGISCGCKLQDGEFTSVNSFYNPKETLDALVDLQYVLSGAINAFGFKEVFDEAFEEVHESNMSKLCVTEKEALETQSKYLETGIETEIEPFQGYFLVLRKSDKKVLKSISYKPAQLDRFLVKA